ncbi:MAG: RagB/SusD family nutrient uptake outer membrane protein [Bacteroidales bacterium]|jgi:hypothetical protein|nr:RagB/SusD family nutrient uptake outer membrane protein [Bacteroidales bacterium]
MKNIINKTIIGIMVISAISLSSCGDDFLHEEKTTAYTTQYFETEEGLTALAASLYANIRWHFAYEWAYGITLYGADEFTNGADLTSEVWNTYDLRFNASNLTTEMGAANKNCPPIDGLWNEMYFGISSANLVIANANNITNEDARKKCLGEAYFLRGYNYYRLFAQYGGVVVQTVPVAGVVRNFKRSSAEETLNQVISDLENAYKQLPVDKWRGIGTWTKYTAAHFWAKALLFRASERNDSWNSTYKETDLAKCVSLCDEVIAACPLADDYWDVYARWTGIDCANEGIPEILMSAQHNGESSTMGRDGYGNRTHSYFSPQFNTFSGNWVSRGAFIGGQDFQRCRPTEYNYSTYDNVNDARLWKSFRTVYGVNNIRDEALNNSFGDQAVKLGDQGIIFILNKKSDTRFNGEPYGKFGNSIKDSPKQSTFINPETNKWVPCAFPLYLDGQYVIINYNSNGDLNKSNVFCGLNKTQDGTRPGETSDANRDIVMARTGETYLVKAEAQVRQGKYGDAINTVNLLRARGQWKNGEDRELYVDGSIAFPLSSSLYKNNTSYSKNNATFNYQDWWKNSNPGYNNGELKDAAGNVYMCKNTYYLSTGIAKTTDASSLQISSPAALPAEDEAILAALGVSGDYDRMLNFIFNERTRELNGEWNRWEELSRAGLLIKRAKAFNPQAAPNIQEKHILRPIPQTFLDGMTTDDGLPLSAEEKQALQNPGY